MCNAERAIFQLIKMSQIKPSSDKAAAAAERERERERENELMENVISQRPNNAYSYLWW